MGGSKSRYSLKINEIAGWQMEGGIEPSFSTFIQNSPHAESKPQKAH